MEISGAKVFDLVWRDGRLAALSESDHILRRFGQVDVVRLNPGEQYQTHREGGADEIWVVIEGQADLSLTDLREESPTSQHSIELTLSAETPQAVLIPFGVLAKIRAPGDALVLRVTSHADGIFPEDKIFSKKVEED